MKLQNIIGEGWFLMLKDFIKGDEWKEIEKFLVSHIKSKKDLYPDLNHIFRPFSECPLEQLKVVVLNNAPFEHELANDGLAFSVSNPEVMYKPPKDAMAFMEGVETDVYGGLNFDRTYDLQPLARQGVLLLNASLTLSKNDKGEWENHYETWRPFIKKVLTSICETFQNIVFIFVGINDFEELSRPVVNSKNYILTLTHPSEANHFAQDWNAANTFKLCNALLKANKIKEIKW